ncbi:MAG: hypothetical protein KGQ37_11660 [Hyphomicrobiales bacterium]|nr:hypothetical protein [Hyphomicrobiales bacterium]
MEVAAVVYLGNCPIWKTPARLTQTAEQPPKSLIDSPRTGGRYKIDALPENILTEIDDQIRARITTWLIEQRQNGIACPEVHSELVKEVRDRASMPVIDKADRLLMYIASKIPTVDKHLNTNTPNDLIPNNDNDFNDKYIYNDIIIYWGLFTCIEATNQDEVKYFIKYLIEMNYITEISNKHYSVTVDGYARLDKLKHRTINSSQAFVAMWFDKSMDDAYDNGISPGIEDAGYKPIRIDRKDHNDKIDDAIIAEIRRSRFLVADFTQEEKNARGGVYYEAGFAHGLNIPVIFTCKENAIDRVHFDTRQYNHITWTDAKDLRNKLAQRISATIGDGPAKNNRSVDEGKSGAAVR